MRLPSRSLIALFALPLLLAGCDKEQPSAPAVAMQTIETQNARSLPPEILPELAEAPRVALGSTGSTGSTASTGATGKGEGDEALTRQMELPFAPPIGIDPVSGQKVGIGPQTPVVQVKNRFYYFEDEGNKRAFLADPERYIKGALATY